jgi:sorbitol-specific phosphotransferase system component IIC
MGIVVGGYGISSTVWSQIQLALTNPNNVEAEAEDGGDAFFTDPDVLDRVPTLIYFMSALYAVVLTIGNKILIDETLRIRFDRSTLYSHLQLCILGILLMSEAPKEEEEAQKIKKLSEKNYSKALSNFARNVLVRPEFYMLAGIRVGFTLVTYTVPAYYKAFGLALGCK